MCFLSTRYVQHTATHGNTLQYTLQHCVRNATTCNAHTYTHTPTSQSTFMISLSLTPSPGMCSTLQYTAAQYNMLQYFAPCTCQTSFWVEPGPPGTCNTLPQYTATRYNAVQHIENHCNTLQRTHTQTTHKQTHIHTL